MDHLNVPDQGRGYLLVAVTANVIAWVVELFKTVDIHAALSNASLLVSIVAAVFAIRHYYLIDKNKNKK